MERKSLFEKLEEGFVFRVSRSFFLILVMLAMLGIVAGAFYLIWGLLPVTKEVVRKEPDPKPLVLRTGDIKNAMKTPKTTEVTKTSTEGKINDTKKEPDRDKIRFEALYDTLKVLLPSKIYSWESAGHWIYPYGRSLYEYSPREDYRKWIVDKPGITDRIKELLSGITEYKDGIAPIEQLCVILRDFSETDRLKPLSTFVDLYLEKKAEYDRTIKQNEDNYQLKTSEANSKYETTIMQKSMAKIQSLIIVGSGIASVAFLAIFLVLLSMQRNMKLFAAANKKE